MLSNLIYTSQSVAEPGSPAFMKLAEDIREEALAFNSAHGITGALLCFGGTFLQVLEGESEAVSMLYAKIRTDPRHHTVHMLWNSEHQARLFSTWSMASSMERIAKQYGVQSDRLAFLADLLPLVAAGSFRMEMLRDLVISIARAFEEEALATLATAPRAASSSGRKTLP